MKRGVFLSLLFFIILVAFVAAQQDTFNIRFHSFGRFATVDLKKYLGESKLYLVSQTKNVIVDIDQERGIATLKARPGWEGSEVIVFRKNESLSELNETEVARFLEEVPETFFLKRIRDEELVRLFEVTIDPSILEIIKLVKREEIRELSTDVEERELKMRINNEVDLKIEMGYIPSVSMDFLLGERREVEAEIGYIRLDVDDAIVIIVLSVIGLLSVYFCVRHFSTKRKDESKKESTS